MGVSASSTKAMGSSAQLRAAEPITTMAGFLQQTARRVASMHWQILSVAETPEPGLFKVWCMVAGNLHCMRVNVPRRFYVHSRVEDLSGQWPQVRRSLPRSQPCQYLYEVTMSERDYRNNQRELISKYVALCGELGKVSGKKRRSSDGEKVLNIGAAPYLALCI